MNEDQMAKIDLLISERIPPAIKETRSFDTFRSRILDIFKDIPEPYFDGVIEFIRENPRVDYIIKVKNENFRRSR